MLPMTNASGMALWHKITSLDLDPMKFSLMDPSEGPGWSRQKADIVGQRYQEFHFLKQTRRQIIVPTKDIDSFWHYHILDTRKYSGDCKIIAGGIIHHFPYFGVRSDEDAENLKAAFAETKRIWLETFGHEPSFELAGIGTDASNSVGVDDRSSICSSCAGDDNANNTIDLLRTSWRPALAIASAA